MKNLHNFERLQTLVPLLKDPRTFAVKAGYFLHETDELRNLVRIVVAMQRISGAFPEILANSWGTQQTKRDWAKHCYQTYGVDESGRAAAPVSIIAIGTAVGGCIKGEAVRVYSGSTTSPPARQRWIPTTESDKITASLFMQELVKNSMLKQGEAMHEEEDIDHILTVNMHESFEHSKMFIVRNGMVLTTSELIPLLSYDRSHFVYDGINFNVQETISWLQSFVNDMKEKQKERQELYGIRHGIPEGSGHDDMYDAFRHLFLCDPSATGEAQRKLGKARELGMGYGMGTHDFLIKAKDIKTFHGASDLGDIQPIKEKETTTMNMTQKASAFLGNLKAIGADLLRVQRGRATLHSAKRVIFSALPFKWGFLARLTGKAKKVENHPFTDLALAFALHGATSFSITDVAKREKYLKYTEEMLVAAGYSASLKMLPIEDMLDKVFAGVSESEAMTKLKEMVKELPEETGIAAHKPQ